VLTRVHSPHCLLVDRALLGSLRRMAGKMTRRTGTSPSSCAQSCRLRRRLRSCRLLVRCSSEGWGWRAHVGRRTVGHRFCVWWRVENAVIVVGLCVRPLRLSMRAGYSPARIVGSRGHGGDAHTYTGMSIVWAAWGGGVFTRNTQKVKVLFVIHAYEIPCQGLGNVNTTLVLFRGSAAAGLPRGGAATTSTLAPAPPRAGAPPPHLPAHTRGGRSHIPGIQTRVATVSAPLPHSTITIYITCGSAVRL
jgi:hypothetical protein